MLHARVDENAAQLLIDWLGVQRKGRAMMTQTQSHNPSKLPGVGSRAKKMGRLRKARQGISKKKQLQSISVGSQLHRRRQAALRQRQSRTGRLIPMIAQLQFQL